jgi:DNA gyrase inhibitor GyrI
VKKSKDQLEKDRRPYIELKQLTQSKAWATVERILHDEFRDAINILIDPNDPTQADKARGTILFIKKFTDTLNSEMGFGKVAQEQYIKSFINPPKDEESVKA